MRCKPRTYRFVGRQLKRIAKAALFANQCLKEYSAGIEVARKYASAVKGVEVDIECNIGGDGSAFDCAQQE